MQLMTLLMTLLTTLLTYGLFLLMDCSYLWRMYILNVKSEHCSKFSNLSNWKEKA